MCKEDGAKPATSNQTQTNAPWSGALPYINQGLQGAQNLYQQGGQQPYPGQTYAGTNDALNSGINQLNGIQSMFGDLQKAAQGGVTGAINTGQNVGNQAGEVANTGVMDVPGSSMYYRFANGDSTLPGMGTLNDYASGKYLSSENPYLSQVIDRTKADVLPSINGAFSQAGRGISGLAGRAQGLGLGDAIGGLRYQNYNQNQQYQQDAANKVANYALTGDKALTDIFNQNQANKLQAGNQQLAGGQLGLQAAQLAPSIQNMGINAGNASLLAGTTAQGLQQGALTDNQTRWNAQQQQPYQNLQDFIRNITGQTGGTGMSTSSGTSTPATPSFFNQALGGGLAAASFFV